MAQNILNMNRIVRAVKVCMREKSNGARVEKDEMLNWWLLLLMRVAIGQKLVCYTTKNVV